MFREFFSIADGVSVEKQALSFAYVSVCCVVALSLVGVKMRWLGVRFCRVVFFLYG